jgi:hypothetical protein
VELESWVEEEEVVVLVEAGEAREGEKDGDSAARRT